MAEQSGLDNFLAGSKVVDVNGQPLRLFHGTVNDFSVFERQFSAMESYYGAGFYFTNNPDDLSQNYARTDGPDLTDKIDRQIEQRMEMQLNDGGSDEDGADYGTIAQQVMAQMTKNLGVSMPVYMSLKRPFVLGSQQESFLDYDDGLSSDAAFGVKTGTLQTFIESLKWVMESFDAESDFDELLAGLQEDEVIAPPGIGATALFEEIKSRITEYLVNPETGERLSQEIIRQALARTGFDGIIDHDVYKRFGPRADSYGRKHQGMPGLAPNTTHFIAFNPEQIKSAIGNNGNFDMQNPDIRFSVAQDDAQGTALLTAGNSLQPSRERLEYQLRLIAAQELAGRVRSTGKRLVIRSDGMVLLHHSTSAANAQSITNQSALTGNTWLSSSKAETLRHVKHKHGASTTTLTLAVDPRHIEFSTGTGEFYAPNGLVRSEHRVWTDPTIANELADSDSKASDGLDALDLAKPANTGAVTNAAALKEWFAQSKAVTAAGAPLVLFHGTRSDISTIELQKTDRLPGFWMTPDPALASTYAAEGVVNAQSYRDGANVMPLFAKIEKPRIYYREKEPMHRAWADYLEGDFDGFFEMGDSGEIASVTVKSGGQVKSALGNVGSFDAKNPDIRLSQIDPADTQIKPSPVTYPSIRAGLVHHGYKLLARGDERRFKTFGTWEKDGVRIALSGNTLGVERGAVMVYQADEGEMTLEALIADSEVRGQGKAKAALVLLGALADATQTTLFLEPVPLDKEGLDMTGLQRFYASAGFTPKDAKSMVMLRKPQSDVQAQSLTTEFKHWFDGSCVVTPQGLPRVMYHGTHEEFTTFQQSDVGFHFGSLQAARNRIASKEVSGDRARVMPVFLNIKNPLRMDDAGDWDNPDMVATYVGDAMINGELDSDAYEAAADSLPTGMDQLTAFREIFKKMGYDGIVYFNVAEGGGDSFIAFDGHQIKSAIGNVGSFDSNSADIRFSNSSVEQLGEALTTDKPNAVKPPVFHSDIPNEAWLKQKQQYSREDGLDAYGVPKTMGPITGRFSRPLDLPLELLVSVPGERAEQSNIRQDSLEWIRANWSQIATNSAYIEVDPTGKAWVSEGNHRIMIAKERGETYFPVEVRYFSGGQRNAGSFSPEILLGLDAVAHADTAKTTSLQYENLTQWFGSSVVKSSDGAPLKVFHATTADFTIFDPLRTNPSSRFGPGLYFTNDIKTLDVYADSRLPGDGGIVMPVYLQLSNPQVDGRLSAEQVEAFFAAIKVEKFPNGYDAKADHLRTKKNALADLSVAFNTLLSAQSAFIDKEDWLRGMDAMGIDGIVREVYGQPEYVVFKSQQVKSAIGNNGQYDPNQPDIRFSQPEESIAQDEITDQQPLQVTDEFQTPSFKNWFGKSRVVDADSKPMVVYHGTQASFKDFSEDMQGTTIHSKDFGFFFTNDTVEASGYAQLDFNKDSPQPNVMPVYLAIQNPWTVILSGQESPYGSPALWYDEEGIDVAKAAIRDGFDGLIVVDEREDFLLPNGSMPTLFVAFKNTQIKSAIGNNGNFDVNHPDIRFSQLEEAIAEDAITAQPPVQTKARPRMPFVVKSDGIRTAVAKVGKRTVGMAHAWDDSRGVFVIMNSEVLDGYRRRGIATAMYKQIEEATGRQLSPAVSLSDDAFEFWKSFRPEAVALDLRHRPELLGRRVIKNGRLGTITKASGGIAIMTYDGPQETTTFIRRDKIDEHLLPEQLKVAAPSQTSPSETAAFDAWFAQSKAVNKTTGKPLVLYHGTNKDFSEFLAERTGTAHNTPEDMGGMYFFTDSAEAASWYAENTDNELEGANVKPVYLSLQNPMIVNFKGAGIETLFEDLEEAKAKGHDGLITLNYNDGGIINQYIAFSPEQIKSAIGNNGQFSRETADIRYSTGVGQANENTTAPNEITLTAYHGTPSDFKTFRTSTRGSFGSGIYFGDVKTAACYANASPAEGEYLPRVIRARLYFKNPLIIQVDYESGLEFELDSPAVPLIRRLFGDQADEILARAAVSEYEGFGTEVQSKAMAQGYDGFILSYPDQSTEYVVFSPEQIQRTGLNVLVERNRALVDEQSVVRSSFAGSLATSASNEKRDAAQQRVLEGENAHLVRRDTGWFMGMDSQWRFEIADDTARLLPLLENLRGGRIEPKVIESVTYRTNDDGTLRLTLNPPNPKTVRDFVRLNHITPELLRALVPKDLIEKISAGLGREDFLGALDDAKCIDHVFEFAGFDALPADLVLDHPALFAAYPMLRNVSVCVDPKLGLGASLGLDADGASVITIGPAYPLKNMLHEMQHAIQNIEGFAEGGVLAKPTAFGMTTPAEIAAADHYHRLAGEVEARNTAARHTMSQAQRQLVAPEATQDVPQERVIIKPNSIKTRPLAPSVTNLPGLPFDTTAPKTTPTPMATPESVRAAVAAMFGPEFQATPGASQILVVNSCDLDPALSRPYSYSLMETLAKQNRHLSINTLMVLANTVSHRKAQAFFEASSRSITMVADRIPAGKEVAVLMHELTHKHGREAMDPLAWSSLVNQLKDWRNSAPGTVERRIYSAAICRTAAVKGLAQQTTLYDEELFAYAVESAVAMGVKPSASAHPRSAQSWLAEVISSIQRVAQKITGNEQHNLTSKDIVDLAYALAQMESPQQSNAIRQAFLDVGLGDLARPHHAQPGVTLDSQLARPLSWYSALMRLVERSDMQSASPQAWKDLLKNASTKGIKPEEIQWSGLLDWLTLQQPQNKKLSKVQVLEYLQSSSVQVQEVFLGGDSQTYQAAVDRFTSDGFEIESDNFFGIELRMDGLPVEREHLSPLQQEDLRVLHEGLDSENPLTPGSSKYASLQMPGGRNYREMLLVLPPRTRVDHALKNRLSIAKEGLTFRVLCDGAYMSDQEQHPTFEHAQAALTRLVESPEPVYTSTHWAGANVLAHVRLNERDDSNGQRTLFIEEIQSDWGQQGKKRGFVGPQTTISGLTASQWRSQAQDLFGRWNSQEDPVFKQWEQAVTNSKTLLEKYRTLGLSDAVEIPSGPFVTTTQSWLNLALKRIVGHAVENGFDQVAFASGDQLVKRFALGRKIHSINWIRTNENTYSLDISETHTARHNVHTNLSAVQMDTLLGKKLTDQIVQNSASQDTMLCQDADIGGDGMRNFYDVIVPSALKNLVAKLDGDGLCEIELMNGDQVCAQTGFVITPAMREMVMQGMALFSLAECSTEAEKNDLVEQVEHLCS